MGKFCCVPGCNNRANRDKFDTKGQTIGYFQFPPDNDPRRAIWIRNIRRDPGPYFTISGTTCVCSMHFEEEYIERLAISTGFRLRLTKEAIPTQFSWNQKEGGGAVSDDVEGNYAHPEPDSDDMNGDDDDGNANGEYDVTDPNAIKTEQNGHYEGGDRSTPPSGAGTSNKRKLNKPQSRATKVARGSGGSRDYKDDTEAEIQRLRTTVQVFERKFAEMSRLVNELRSTTIKMLGVMSAGTQQGGN